MCTFNTQLQKHGPFQEVLDVLREEKRRKKPSCTAVQGSCTQVDADFPEHLEQLDDELQAALATETGAGYSRGGADASKEL